MDNPALYLTALVFNPQVMFITLINTFIAHIPGFLPTPSSCKLLIGIDFLAVEIPKSLCVSEFHNKGGRIISSAAIPILAQSV